MFKIQFSFCEYVQGNLVWDWFPPNWFPLDSYSQRKRIGPRHFRFKARLLYFLTISCLNIWNRLYICLKYSFHFACVLFSGVISFPGGKIESGESCVDTALRESFEEIVCRQMLFRFGAALGPSWLGNACFSILSLRWSMATASRESRTSFVWATKCKKSFLLQSMRISSRACITRHFAGQRLNHFISRLLSSTFKTTKQFCPHQTQTTTTFQAALFFPCVYGVWQQ